MAKPRHPNSNIFSHYSISRPTKTEKLYQAYFAMYVYGDGKVEVIKNRYGSTGDITLGEAINYFSKMIAEIKFKDTQFDMFKEGLSQLIQEAIENTLKGDFSNERTVCRKSGPNGS